MRVIQQSLGDGRRHEVRAGRGRELGSSPGGCAPRAWGLHEGGSLRQLRGPAGRASRHLCPAGQPACWWVRELETDESARW